MKRSILPTQSWRHTKYQVNERVMISNHLPEFSTCIRASTQMFSEFSETDGVQIYFLLAVHPTLVLPLISLVSQEMRISCVVKQIQSSQSFWISALERGNEINTLERVGLKGTMTYFKGFKQSLVTMTRAKFILIRAHFRPKETAN